MKTNKFDVCLSIKGIDERIWVSDVETTLSEEELITTIFQGHSAINFSEVDEVFPSSHLTLTTENIWVAKANGMTHGFKPKDVVCVRVVDSNPKEEGYGNGI